VRKRGIQKSNWQHRHKNRNDEYEFDAWILKKTGVWKGRMEDSWKRLTMERAQASFLLCFV
jgi:hypothetical protein